MFCPKCGAENREGNRFCSSCGAALAHRTGPAATDSARAEGMSTEKASPAPAAVIPVKPLSTDWIKTSWKGLLYIAVGIVLAILGGVFWENAAAWIGVFAIGMALTYYGIFGLSVPGHVKMIASGAAFFLLLVPFASWAVAAVALTLIAGGIIYYLWIVRGFSSGVNTSLSPNITGVLVSGLVFAGGCGGENWWIIIIGGMATAGFVWSICSNLRKEDAALDGTDQSSADSAAPSGSEEKTEKKDGGERPPAVLRRQLVLVGGMCAAFVLILTLGANAGFGRMTSRSYEVRNSYLTAYSTDVTIGDAFDAFFENPQWSSEMEDGYDYVVFTGEAVRNDGTPVQIRVLFYVEGQRLEVASIQSNGSFLNAFETANLLNTIYGV